MSKKNKYDILNEVKKFPKVKTSDNFLDELHLKLDKVIEEEKFSKDPSSKKKTGFIKGLAGLFKENNLLSGIFKKKYFVPAFATVVFLIFLFYFYYQNKSEQLADIKELNEKVTPLIPEIPEIPEIKNPFIAGKGDSLLKIDPAEELDKLVTKGKDVSQKTAESLSLLIREKERELRVFDPQKTLANFGKFNLVTPFNELNKIDLRSQSFTKERLEGLKSKIDSAVGK